MTRTPRGIHNRAKGKEDDGKLDERFLQKQYEIPEAEHQEEVARHPLAWLIMTARRAQEDRTG